MSQLDRETIPTEVIAAIIYRLTRFGMVQTRDMAERFDYTYRGVDSILNKAALQIPITNVGRGTWIVADEVAEVAERGHDAMNRLKTSIATVGHVEGSHCTITRADAICLVHALETLLRRPE